jgi:formiminotetrahydrofolate cyclodeaminase
MELEEFIDRLASAEPSPGGGAAAALTGALAAGLFAKACNLTIGREKFKAVEADVRRLLDQVEPLRRRLFDLIEADAAAYRQVAAAYRMPRQSDAEKAARTEAIQAALKRATEVPLAIAEACRDLLRLGPEVAAKTNPALRSDVALGAVLAHAAAHGVWFNIKDNLDNVTDEKFRIRVADSVARIQRDCDTLLAEVSRTLPDYFVKLPASNPAAG